jgi:hypothetical protein
MPRKPLSEDNDNQHSSRNSKQPDVGCGNRSEMLERSETNRYCERNKEESARSDEGSQDGSASLAEIKETQNLAEKFYASIVALRKSNRPTTRHNGLCRRLRLVAASEL